MLRDDEKVICKYKNECTGYPGLCIFCRHNKNRKNFFSPIGGYVYATRNWRRINPITFWEYEVV